MFHCFFAPSFLTWITPNLLLANTLSFTHRKRAKSETTNAFLPSCTLLPYRNRPLITHSNIPFRPILFTTHHHHRQLYTVCLAYIPYYYLFLCLFVCIAPRTHFALLQLRAQDHFCPETQLIIPQIGSKIYRTPTVLSTVSWLRPLYSSLCTVINRIVEPEPTLKNHL